MTTVKYPIVLIATILWIGFVCSISFMESWIKFSAPGVTIPIGLGIGRLVFGVLNKVEWLFVFTILGSLILLKGLKFSFHSLLIIIPFIILIIQTIYSLPTMDVRAEMQIQGQSVAPSNLHFYYVGMEIVKVFCLSIFGLCLFKQQPTQK